MSRQPLSLGFEVDRSRPLAASRLINLYMSPAPLNSRAPKFPNGPFSTIGGESTGTPGLIAFATLSAGRTVRCAIFGLGFIYALVDSTVYQIAQNGTVVACTGDFILPNGPAMMTYNGVQVTLLSQGLCFVVIGTIVTLITAAAYPSAGVSSIDTIDGYTLFSTAGGASATYGTPITISNITQANPAIVTADGHGLADNSQVLIESVSGMTQVNGESFTILVVDVNSFQLIGVDSTAYGAYAGGGTVQAVTSQANGQWFISALYDSTTLDPLQFATKESKPDPLLRLIVANHQVWLMGSESIEPWTDAGTSPFPFAQVTGSIMDRGIAAPLSATDLAGVLLWLGDDLIVYGAAAYTPVRISNFAVDEAIRAMAVKSIVSDAVGFNYTQGGHPFYVLTFPTAGRTLVYDTLTQVWHERRSGTQLTDAIWTVTCTVEAWGKVYAGTSTGALGVLDLDTYTELSAPIRRAAVSPPLYNDGKRATVPTVELECELGIGLTTGQGSNPTVTVRWSDDGGATFSNERTASLGKTGNRIDRARIFRTGIFRQREYEFAISDPVKVSFYGMNFNAVGANS